MSIDSYLEKEKATPLLGPAFSCLYDFVNDTALKDKEVAASGGEDHELKGHTFVLIGKAKV